LNAGGLILDQYGTVSDNNANLDGGGIYSTGQVTMFSGSSISGNQQTEMAAEFAAKKTLKIPL